ncbi:MAG: DUF2283 domain-containing protein [bacterium]|nr:DUF2283 domain-containing protein [bacterium]
MKVRFDKEVDVMKIVFNNNAITESEEEKPGVNLDYDAHGNIVAMEILNASKSITSPL